MDSASIIFLLFAASLRLLPAIESRIDAVSPRDAPMAIVGPTLYKPFVPASGKEGEKLRQPAFLLDVAPVTNADFLRFVRAEPSWRQGAPPRLFAEERYLSHWAAPLDLGRAPPDAPVVSVSWFAARAYCSYRGARLPTEQEWETVAAASTTQPDGRADPVWAQTILAWYAAPTQPTRSADQGPLNFWKIRNLHGLVWEWVEDFSSVFVTSDARDREGKSTRFCGGSALTSSDRADYASFMRYAFRSSLQGNSTTTHLGFRCAKDLGVSP